MIKKICEDAMHNALEFTMEKCRIQSREVALENLKEGDCCFHGYFRYYLIAYMCNCISPQIKDLEGVYLYGSSLIDKMDLTSDINIILHTKEHHADNQELLKKINLEISTRYRDTFSLEHSGQFNLIDYHFVNDSEVKGREGIATVIDSLENPALQIWERPDKIQDVTGSG
jgi:hypothetical protein